MKPKTILPKILTVVGITFIQQVGLFAQTSTVPWSVFDMGFNIPASSMTSVKSIVGQTFIGTSVQLNTRVESGFLTGPWLHATASISVDVQGGWNMVAVPNHVSDPRKTVLFPGAISNAFEFKNGYVTAESLRMGRGYWLKFSQIQTVSISGLPAIAETIAVVQGWNLIGGISSPVATTMVGSIPPGIVVSNFFKFVTLQGYESSVTIDPGKGYWVKTDQAGSLIISTGPAIPGRVLFHPTAELPPPPPDEMMEDDPALPSEYGLEKAFPNPFNPGTRIQYMLPAPGHVRLRIYNVIGELVATLVDQQEEAGVRTVNWNAATLPGGVYFYCLMAGPFTETRKMILIR